MQRRTLLLATPALLSACGSEPVKTFATVSDAAKAIEALSRGWRSTGAWTLPQMLNHAAQSIEYSLHGFPKMKSAVFRHTVGAAAFAVFDARGAMSHALDEPIPGAPTLPATDTLDTAITRCLKSLKDFDQHTGTLHPHFAYGALDKAQFTRAHLMHIANHWTEVVRA